MNDQVPVPPGTCCPRCGHQAEPPLGDGQRLAETVLALIAAQLGELPRPVLDEVLQEAPAGDAARVLAWLVAWILGQSPGGDRWLQRLALAVAGEGE
ncbi:hypothetical protein [Streptacidiphilus albus]|uniref:hypothetical protein n=1 Tax=Streptacidiphilus albus TaxID=105425 RepID=UPI00054B4F3A|nr:hypothetical protein [Streptacidiphilus albus]